MQMAAHRKNVGGSLIGSIAPDIQVIDIKDFNDAYNKVEDGESRFRFVIKNRNSQEPAGGLDNPEGAFLAPAMSISFQKLLGPGHASLLCRDPRIRPGIEQIQRKTSAI